MLKTDLVLIQRHLLEHLAACNSIVDNVLFIYVPVHMYSMIWRIKIYNTRDDSVIRVVQQSFVRQCSVILVDVFSYSMHIYAVKSATRCANRILVQTGTKS